MTARLLIAALAVLIGSAAFPSAHAQPSSDPRIADLVQAGKVRVALGLGSPMLAMKNASTGEMRGPALDLANALAKRRGVKL